ncbi:MAG: acyl-ACP thioesterase domain-containing protein [Lachnospiraceae bacterium]|nr:acyl-ACP thioesterase domain-containing protein [Lachnospiraceae bacterium]
MYEYTSRVRYSEIDPDLHMTPSAVIARLEDGAVFHSEVSRMPMLAQADMKEAWMVISWQVVFSRWPRFNQKITTRTWTCHFHGFEGCRDYTMTDEEGDVLVTATSRWCYMDLVGQHPMRVPQSVADNFGLEDPLDMERAPRRIALPKDVEPEAGEGVRMTVSSLDNNGHVNNLEYVRIALGYFGQPIERLREMRVEYRTQAHLGDLLTPLVYKKENSVYVSLVNEEQTSCAIVRFMIN